MGHTSHSTKTVGIWVVDRHHLLRHQLDASLPTSCNITVYEARTRAEALSLAQDVKPDVMLIDLGGQAVSAVKILRQPFTEHIYRDLLVPSDREEIQAELTTDIASPSSIDEFTLALCHECSELLQLEPDMVHQFFRTWRHGCLDRQDTNDPQGKQLKVLVLTCPTCPNASESTWLEGVEQRTQQLMLSQREWRGLFSWNASPQRLKAHLSHLLRCARSWLTDSWRVTWQLDHPLR